MLDVLVLLQIVGLAHRGVDQDGLRRGDGRGCRPRTRRYRAWAEVGRFQTERAAISPVAYICAMPGASRPALPNLVPNSPARARDQASPARRSCRCSDTWQRGKPAPPRRQTWRSNSQLVIQPVAEPGNDGVVGEQFLRMLWPPHAVEVARGRGGDEPYRAIQLRRDHVLHEDIGKRIPASKPSPTMSDCPSSKNSSTVIWDTPAQSPRAPARDTTDTQRAAD